MGVKQKEGAGRRRNWEKKKVKMKASVLVEKGGGF